MWVFTRSFRIPEVVLLENNLNKQKVNTDLLRVFLLETYRKLNHKTYVIDRTDAVLLSQKWIKEWGKVPIKTGMYGNIAMAVENEKGEIIYVGFIWESPTEMAMIGFITRNPKTKTKIKDLRKIFIQSIIAHIKELGYNFISSWCADAGLKNDFLEIGCVETSNTVSEFFAELK